MRRLRLGHHLAVVVGVVAIDHHAVEAGEGAHGLRGDVVELRQRRRAVELTHRAAHGLIGVGERERPWPAGKLELDDQARRGQLARRGSGVALGGSAPEHRAVQQRVDRDRIAVDVQGDLDRVALAQVPEGAGGAGDRLGGRDPEHGGQRTAESLPPADPTRSARFSEACWTT